MDWSLSSSDSASLSSGQRTAHWALSFDSLLADGQGLRVFQEFLEQEFSQENLNFWLDCQKLRRMSSRKEIRKLVKSIYSCYFAHTARQAINVDSDARAEADADILDPSSAAFAAAEAQVYNLMKDDSYARFLKSEVFAQQLRSEISKVAHRKDYGIVSWYKTSLKPRLSLSTNKPPAPLPRCPLPPLPPAPEPRPIRDPCSRQQKQRPMQSVKEISAPSGRETVIPIAIGQDQENNPPNAHQSGKQMAFDDFPIPESLWQLSDENEYEDFFCDLLTASHKSNDVRRGTAMGRRSNSHPLSLADTINQVALNSSPSMDSIWSDAPITSRSRKTMIFRSPPPPLPPKSMRRVQPLPPPPVPCCQRTMRV